MWTDWNTQADLGKEKMTQGDNEEKEAGQGHTGVHDAGQVKVPRDGDRINNLPQNPLMTQNWWRC